jgi:hypothetical protein
MSDLYLIYSLITDMHLNKQFLLSFYLIHMCIKVMRTVHLYIWIYLFLTELNLKSFYVKLLEYQFFKGKNKAINMRPFGQRFIIYNMALFLQNFEGLKFGNGSEKS